jgi:hypothetical protein
MTGRWPRSLIALAVLAGLGAGCSSHRSATNAAVAAPALTTPMATSVDTTAGTWATVPMGRLDQPLNTFWQLLYRRAGSASWSNQVEATATATNGGLVLATPAGHSLIVGIRPSNLLAFTPLIATTNGAHSWTSGLMGQAIQARPAALAASATGDAVALVDNGKGPSLLTTAGNLSSWSAFTTQAAVTASAGVRACGPSALTAVAYLGEQPLLGASCGQPGAVGLLTSDGASWQLTGAALPASLAGDRTEVLDLQAVGGGVAALIAATGPAGTDLIELVTTGPGGVWRPSAPLPLPPADQVISVGPAAGGAALFALVQPVAGGPETLSVTGSSGATWNTLPGPPVGTETVAFDGSAPVAALDPAGNSLHFWNLADGATSWTAGQTLAVPIQYGSSS